MHLFIVTRFLRILRDLVVALARSKDHEIARQSRDPLHYPWSSLTHLCFYDRACAFSSYRECCVTVLCRTFARSEKCLFHYNVYFTTSARQCLFQCIQCLFLTTVQCLFHYKTMSVWLSIQCLFLTTMSISLCLFQCLFQYNVYFSGEIVNTLIYRVQ